MKNQRKQILEKPNRLSSYWLSEWRLCILIALSGLIYNFGMLAFPFFQGVLIDTISLKENESIWSIVLLYVGIIFLVQIARSIKRYTVRLFANRTSGVMRFNIYDNLLHKSEKELDNVSVSSLLTRCFSDCDQCVEGMRKLTTEIFDTIALFIFYIAYLFLFDVKITLLSLIPIALSVAFAFLFKKKLFSYSLQSRKSNAKMVNKTYDMFSNALLYRTYSRNEDFLKEYDASLSDYEKDNYKTISLADTMIPLCDLIALLGLIFILYFGSGYVLEKKALFAPLGFMQEYWTPGVLTTYISTFVLLSTKASHIAKMLSSIEKGLASWKRIAAVISPISGFEKGKEVQGDTLQIKAMNLKTENRTLISSLSLTLHRGEILGVTGEIASGKSAFGKVFLSDIDYSGNVILFSKEMKDYTKEEISGTVVYMGHHSQLLTMSIKDNVLYGKDEDVFPFLSQVSFEKDLESMKDKENTIIGNEGVLLSGGQQERIALARTIAHKKKLIVLDDPFASVDKKTEKEIISHIREISKDSIVILISHRLSLFPELDHILYLHGDSTFSYDTHERLLKEDDAYRHLYLLQEEEK